MNFLHNSLPCVFFFLGRLAPESPALKPLEICILHRYMPEPFKNI